MSPKQSQTASAPLPHPSKGLVLAGLSWAALAVLGSLMVHILG